jgi:hypothetical protein
MHSFPGLKTHVLIMRYRFKKHYPRGKELQKRKTTALSVVRPFSASIRHLSVAVGGVVAEAEALVVTFLCHKRVPLE